MSAPASIRSADDYFSVGAVASHIRWAMAAAEHGEAENALHYLRKAQEALLPAFPTMRMGATDLYTPGIKLTPPALSNEEMADLIAGDEAAERRAEAWERAKRLADAQGEGA